MNTRPVIEESSGPVSLTAAFNQDASCFAVGLDSGFCVFNADTCELKVARDFNGGIGPVEMLGRANYLALVGGGRHPKYSPNKVIIWDDNKQHAVITLEFRAAVHRVRLSKSRIVVALHNSVHTYAFSSPPEKISAFETADNPRGLCCLGPRLIVFPGRTPGQIQLVDIASGNISIVPAHSTRLQSLAVSPNGEFIATASETGTLIRIFSTSNCARLGELRRGVDHAHIFSLAISPDSRLLASTSDKGTLHVFDIPRTGSSRNSSRDGSSNRKNSDSMASAGSDEDSNQKWGALGKIPLMPRIFSDVYSITSARFEMDDVPPDIVGARADGPIPGIPGGKAEKGIVGWQDEHTILVLGAGREGRWEKFILGEAEDGRRVLVRRAWKRYFGH